MDFNNKDYSGKDFRKEQDLYTMFYYDEVSVDPCKTRCTEYFYRRVGDNRYHLIFIDRYDDEIIVNRVLSAYDLVKFLNEEASKRQMPGYWDLDLSERWMDTDPDRFMEHYNTLTANLFKYVYDEEDSSLFTALDNLFYGDKPW